MGFDRDTGSSGANRTAKGFEGKKGMRIYVTRACGIGDAVQMTPFLKSLRQAFPRADITVGISSYALPILENLDSGLKLEKLPKSVLSKSLFEQMIGWSLVALRIFNRYDMAFFFVTPYRNTLPFKFSRIKRRVGILTLSWKPIIPYTEVVRIPNHAGEMASHISDVFLEALRLIKRGVVTDRNYSYRMWDEELQWSCRVLPRTNSRMIGLCPETGNPGSVFPTKTYPLEHWIDLSRLLANEGYFIYVFAGRRLSQFECMKGVTNFSGSFQIRDTLALMSRMDLVVSADSGLLHAAVAMGKKVVELFGPTDPKIYGTLSQASSVLRQEYPCIPCYKPRCLIPEIQGLSVARRPFCMYNILPQQILKEVERMLRIA